MVKGCLVWNSTKDVNISPFMLQQLRTSVFHWLHSESNLMFLSDGFYIQQDLGKEHLPSPRINGIQRGVREKVSVFNRLRHINLLGNFSLVCMKSAKAFNAILNYVFCSTDTSTIPHLLNNHLGDKNGLHFYVNLLLSSCSSLSVTYCNHYFKCKP